MGEGISIFPVETVSSDRPVMSISEPVETDSGTTLDSMYDTLSSDAMKRHIQQTARSNYENVFVSQTGSNDHVGLSEQSAVRNWSSTRFFSETYRFSGLQSNKIVQLRSAVYLQENSTVFSQSHYYECDEPQGEWVAEHYLNGSTFPSSGPCDTVPYLMMVDGEAEFVEDECIESEVYEEMQNCYCDDGSLESEKLGSVETLTYTFATPVVIQKPKKADIRMTECELELNGINDPNNNDMTLKCKPVKTLFHGRFVTDLDLESAAVQIISLLE